MFYYTICTVADRELFFKQCAVLEKNIPNLEKGELVKEEDGSMTQQYKKGEAKICVHNSEYMRSLYIDSEIELEKFLK